MTDNKDVPGKPLSISTPHDALVKRMLVEPFALNFRFLIDDLAETTEEAIIKQTPRSDAVRLLRLMLKFGQRTPDLLDKVQNWRTMIANIARQEKGSAALETVLNYTLNVNPHIEAKAMAHALNPFHDIPWNPLPGTPAARFKEEGRQEGIQKGRQEGIQKGRQEGIQKGRQETLLKLLQLKFRDAVTVDIEARVREATGEDVARWIEGVLTAESIHALLDL